MDLGLAADVGTLQRLPRVVGSQSWVRDVVYTARRVTSQEALTVGLVSAVLPDREQTLSHALKMAEDIASKSPVAVQGSKVNLNYSRDHSVQDGLDFAVSVAWLWSIPILYTACRWSGTQPCYNQRTWGKL